MHFSPLIFIAAFALANFIADTPSSYSAESECTGENCPPTTQGGHECESKKEDVTS